MTTQTLATRTRRRAPTVAPVAKFNARVIKLTVRPRLQAGDLVELCGTVLPGNLGRICIITGLRDDGWILTESLTGLLDTIDQETGAITYRTALVTISRPENLYRLDNSLKAKFTQRIRYV